MVTHVGDTAITSQITPPPAIEISGSPVTGEQPVALTLWDEAFRKVNNETQGWIRSQGLDSPEQAKSDDLINMIKQKSKSLLEEKNMPFKIEIGNQKIVFREYIADIITFLSVAGDFVISFSPTQARAPWAAAKAVLSIPVTHIEQIATLAGIVELFTRIVHRGQVYEHLYTATTTHKDALSNLRDALRDLYTTAIELLSRSAVLVKGGLTTQTLNAILRPNKASGLISELWMKEQKVLLEAQVCEASRSAQAGETMDGRIEALFTSLGELSTPLTRIDKGVDNVLEVVEQDRLERLMDFISSEKFGKDHITIKETRIEGTGDWLINHERFRDWQASVLVKHTLPPGRSGPLMLDPLVVLRSFVRQLSYKASHYDRIQTSVIQKCELAKREGRDLGYKECKKLITASLNLYSKTTFILDALDESEISMYNLAEIFIELMEQATKPVKVFISSRPDRQYLKVFEDKCIITVSSDNQKGDIEKYLDETLCSQSIFNRCKAEIQEIIKETFRSRNDGMFRWVYLQVKSLLKCISDDAVKAWARTIPHDLMAAYDQLWENIREQHTEDDVALAERAVQWVLCAFEPLKSDILLEAVRYSLEGDALVRKEKQSEEEILLLCQDLLTIDAERGIWTLPHASVAEYFESRNLTPGKCDVFASITSLSFLMGSEFHSSHIERNGNHFDTFEGYISHTWPRHVQRYDAWLGSTEGAEPDQKLVTTLKHFLGSVEESGDHYRTWLKEIHAPYYLELTPESMTLFVMCRFGFYHVLRDWWEDGRIDEEMALRKCASYPGYDSLALAARGRCLPICRYLVGVIGLNNPLAQGHCRAMEQAIEGSNQDVVSFLIEEANADVNVCYCDETAAQFAARLWRTDMLQWLMDQGWIDINREGGKRYGNVLIAAATSDHVKSIEILLKAGADVNAAVECGDYGSALVAAATTSRCFEYLEKIQLLLGHGADPNHPMKGGKYVSALEAVVASAFEWYFEDNLAENIQSLALLLEAGADPAAINNRGEHGSALATAAFYGFKDFLKMMIGVTGRERAIECLGQSRCPKKLYFSDKRHMESWRQARSDTIAYLTSQVGVDNEILYRIGLRDIEPEKDWEQFVVIRIH
ncbi:uncharacterized protein Triagg1_5409 [Trichoderma aggressivum f. europaeum]|uniref:Nephrocystin 3-like N-terminal domain-containing protein n=1 Tax=Trichoderma aggressivum f. europaeum TaxID=173218 RepID=A0AAE1IEF5_9HYPO|nr:hypothetical protein Triagg1_5409 [Trichoderma aggressivum f. europaeum]